jgi:hypothetical protein
MVRTADGEATCAASFYCNHTLDSVSEHVERVPPTLRQWLAIQICLEAKNLLAYDKVPRFELLDEYVDKRLEGLRHQPLAVLIPAEHDHLPLGSFYIGIQIDSHCVFIAYLISSN